MTIRHQMRQHEDEKNFMNARSVGLHLSRELSIFKRPRGKMYLENFFNYQIDKKLL